MTSRARARAIRAYAAEEGLPYTVAARHVDVAVASRGRTVYPADGDERRAWVLARLHRDLAERVRDTRLAATLPDGRAEHLVARFPVYRGLYDGPGRERVLARVLATAATNRPELVPAVGDLTWTAEMGEESAVDMACNGLDRATRRLLEDADEEGGAGARQILDAVLVVADDGHAPGTVVRLLCREHHGQEGLIVGAHWGPDGPPYAYDVRVADGTLTELDPHTLAVIPDQEALPTRL